MKTTLVTTGGTLALVALCCVSPRATPRQEVLSFESPGCLSGVSTTTGAPFEFRRASSGWVRDGGVGRWCGVDELRAGDGPIRGALFEAPGSSTIPGFFDASGAPTGWSMTTPDITASSGGCPRTSADTINSFVATGATPGVERDVTSPSTTQNLV